MAKEIAAEEQEALPENIKEDSGENPKTSQKEQREKKKVDFLETFIVFMLGLTALLTAWATWISSLHSGNQSRNYTLSNSYKSEGVAAMNEATLQYQNDLKIYTDIIQIIIDSAVESNYGGMDADLNDAILEYRLSLLLEDNLTDRLEAVVIKYADKIGTDEYSSPFNNKTFVDEYYAEANELLELADEHLNMGNEDNQKADRLGMVTVIYSIVLFLLGIANSFEKKGSKYVLVGLAIAGFIVGTVFMISVPLPDGFSFASFLS